MAMGATTPLPLGRWWWHRQHAFTLGHVVGHRQHAFTLGLVAGHRQHAFTLGQEVEASAARLDPWAGGGGIGSTP